MLVIVVTDGDIIIASRYNDICEYIYRHLVVPISVKYVIDPIKHILMTTLFLLVLSLVLVATIDTNIYLLIFAKNAIYMSQSIIMTYCFEDVIHLDDIRHKMRHTAQLNMAAQVPGKLFSLLLSFLMKIDVYVHHRRVLD